MREVAIAEQDCLAVLELLATIPEADSAWRVRKAFETARTGRLDPGGEVRLVECPSRNDIEWILSAIKDFLRQGHPTESQQKSLNRVSAKLNSVLAS